MTSRLAKLSLFLLMLFMVGCDHATKHAAVAMLSSRSPVELLPGVLDLRYAENHDTAFSMLSRFGVHGGGALAIAVVALLVTVMLALVWASRRRVASRLEHLGFALALSGAVGNVADRLVRGFVVDFIHVRHWPVFNVADMAIAVGIGLLAWVQLRAEPTPAPDL